MNYIVVRSFFILLLLFSSNAFATDFDDYKKEFSDNKFYDNVNNDFGVYQAALNKEFDIYQGIVEKEFKRFSSNINKKWDKVVVSNSNKWVEYSKDFTKRNIVDFESNSIGIEVIVPEKASEQQLIDIAVTELQALIVTTNKDAWEKDHLSQQIESEVKKRTKYYKTDKVGNEPILEDLFFDSKPSKSQLEHKVLSLLKSGKLKLIKNSQGKAVLSVNISLPDNKSLKKANKIKPFVDKYAVKHKMPPELIFAIIHNESSFNPMARSYVPAYGLMQIVPKTAGKDATKHLFGKSQLLLPSYLYKKENNINIGTAYMHLLYYRYMRKIKNPESRMYCTIAAYNTGSGNVAKVFAGVASMTKAAPIINSKTPAEVYDSMIKNLPYKETRKYLKKVVNTMLKYKSI